MLRLVMSTSSIPSSTNTKVMMTNDVMPCSRPITSCTARSAQPKLKLSTIWAASEMPWPSSHSVAWRVQHLEADGIG